MTTICKQAGAGPSRGHTPNTSKLASALMLAAGLAAGMGALVSPAAQAADNPGYVTDQRGNPVKSGAGLCWRTNQWTPALALEECDPGLAPKSAAPTPAPVASQTSPAAAPTQAAAPKRCDFSTDLQADQLFALGKAKLNKAAEKRLQEVVGKARSSCGSISLVVITGHTDRLGKAQSNQKLSEQRAEAVKKFLVKQGFAADTLDTFGAGKTQPVAGLKCDDRLPRAKLVQCLAPNRRVTVEIKGTAK